MNILIYGSIREKELLIQHMKSHACMAFRKITYLQTEDYDEFLQMMKTYECEMVFVTRDNADGMEGVIAAQNLQPQVPIIWISNDKSFGAQSYRLGVAYFGVKPIDKKVVETALKRCQQREEMAI